MQRLMRAALFAATLLQPTMLPAQSIPKDFGSDVKHGVLDILAVWASPFRGSLRGYAIGAASLGVSGLSAIVDDNVAAWIRKHPDAGVMRALGPFREGNGMSLVNIGAGHWHQKGALAVYGVGLFARSRTVRDIGMGCLASVEAHSALRQVVYQSVSRERPLFHETVGGSEIDRPGRTYVVKFPGKDTWFDNSFFAGHVTAITGCVSFINHRFHLGYAEPVLWAFGAALSVGRMADQRHYTSDVLVGGLIGFAVGKVVGDRSRERAEKRAGLTSKTAPDSGKGDSRSWTDGVYLSRVGSATLLGWRTQR